jgi:hypothetical protein
MMDFSRIETLQQFLSATLRIIPDKRAERIYNRIFDRKRDQGTINGTGWDCNEGWLKQNMHSGFVNATEYLLMAYKAVKIAHSQQQAQHYDQWNKDRFIEFEQWVFSHFRINQENEKAIINLIEDDFICNIQVIKPSYDYFVSLDMFEDEPSLIHYMDCFNNSKTPNHFKFKHGKQIMFVYFLIELSLRIKIIEERFNIKNIGTQKSRLKRENKPSAVFVNKIQSIITRAEQISCT